jgi:hypothetical protein
MNTVEQKYILLIKELRNICNTRFKNETNEEVKDFIQDISYAIDDIDYQESL